jgi:hypothetical protein
MGLKEGVLRGIYGYGFVKPSPIQQKGILPVIQSKDTIAQVNFILNNNFIFRRNLELERQVASLYQFSRLLTPAQPTARHSLSHPPESSLSKLPSSSNRSENSLESRSTLASAVQLSAKRSRSLSLEFMSLSVLQVESTT